MKTERRDEECPVQKHWYVQLYCENACRLILTRSANSARPMYSPDPDYVLSMFFPGLDRKSVTLHYFCPDVALFCLRQELILLQFVFLTSSHLIFCPCLSGLVLPYPVLSSFCSVPFCHVLFCSVFVLFCYVMSFLSSVSILLFTSLSIPLFTSLPLSWLPHTWQL